MGYHDEAEFHDAWACSESSEGKSVKDYFEASTAPENRIILKRLGDIHNISVLELGSGFGEASAYFAQKGARVTATDVSEKMLRAARQISSKHAVSINTVLNCSDRLPFHDSLFDVVYAANVLHHVPVEPTLVEAVRVLKKGGLFVSWDPLCHNPIIAIYRKLAAHVRTTDEHPLKYSDRKLFMKYFSEIEHHTTWLCTLMIFMKFYLIDKINPNKVRYWKKIIYDHKKLSPLYNRLERCDHFILKWLPFLKKYCWNLVVIARK
jgi:SAM-dependent methyltransferase